MWGYRYLVSALDSRSGRAVCRSAHQNRAKDGPTPYCTVGHAAWIGQLSAMALGVTVQLNGDAGSWMRCARNESLLGQDLADRLSMTAAIANSRDQEPGRHEQ